MLKTIIVLPDGTEVSSGTVAGNVIQSCTVTECVNSGTELTLGSVCAAMVEIKLITPGGGLQIAAGDELTLYKDNGNTRQQLGVFIAEKPTRLSAHTMKLTAYDHVSLLDKDLTGWLAALTDWPYTLYDLSVKVCDACGLELVNTEIPNGSYMVQKFSAEGITGRQLMQWVGQAAGRFCRATPDGKVEFAWYTPAVGHSIGASPSHGGGSASVSYEDGALTITDPNMTSTEEGGVVTVVSNSITVKDLGGGLVEIVVLGNVEQHFFFQGSLSFEDYVVAPIEKVQIQQSAEDVGVIWPNNTDAVNTYRITGNLLLTDERVEALQPIAQALYDQLRVVNYTPCNVTIVANLDIRAGNTVSITDRNGKTIKAYIMTKRQTGQKDMLECTGSPRRDSVSAVNEQSFSSLSGKVLNLRMDVDGIRAENKNASGRLSKLEFSVDGINTTVQGQSKSIGGLRDDLVKVQQNARQFRIDIQSIQDNGVSKVKTGANYTFDDNGLQIAREGELVANLLDNKGMQVTRSGETVLKANSDGVEATDVKVNNYLIIGENSRLEDYQGGRTACFYVGG